ncbi:MAG: bifunctional metallophosphatase/5'-nucleotidase [bacterium]
MRNIKKILLSGIFVCCVLPNAFGQQETTAQKFTIIHTNDLQSKLSGLGPNADYSPLRTGDDHTIGGIARVATVIKELKNRAPEQTLVFDGGDMLMGSLFHTVAREQGGELRIMAEIGYDAMTAGNHEFDFGPDGLARILQSAANRGALPQIVLANAVFDDNDPGDDTLAQLFENGSIRPYTVLSRNGLKIGVVGLMGKDAAEVAPFSRPVTFADPIESAKAVVKTLKEKEHVDLIIALSHSGVRKNPGDGTWRGEDIELARAVPEIDVVVGGHSHTLLREPIMVSKTPVVQAGEHGQHVGVLNLEIVDGQIKVQDYRIVEINDDIPGDPHVQAEVERLKTVVDSLILQPLGYTFEQPLMETKFDLNIALRETNLGNLVADAIRWGIDRSEATNGNSVSKLDVVIEANGQIRDHILKGERGVQQVSDLFRPVGLGIGVVEKTPGYPLVKFYVTTQEIKRALEVLTTVHPMKGPSYHLQVSGMRFRYNPNRLMFDRVIDVEIETDSGAFVSLDLSSSNNKLYSIGTNYYVASFIKLIGSFTYGILEIAPKHEDGRPVENMREALVDANPEQAGIQELKEWVVFLDFIRSFSDNDGDGIADMPERYRTPEGRIVKVESWNPVLFFKNATYLTWGATGVVIVVIVGVFLAAVVFWRRRRR